MTNLQGFIQPGFEGVRDAFSANFEDGLECGASVAVTQNGRFVVDLWAGDRDAKGQPWEEDTIVHVYSITKTMAAMSVLLLVDRGLVDLQAPVAAYWPEFASNGKAAITVAQVMHHSAGLSGFDPALKSAECLYDWEACVTQLAAQAPWWPPGTASGYHAVTQGYLQGEIVRRVTGKDIGTFFYEEIAAPLGADFHLGLALKHDSRVAELILPAKPLNRKKSLDSIAVRTHDSVRLTGKETLTRQWRGAQIPASNGIGHARAIARIHSLLACAGTLDGMTLMSASGVENIFENPIRGTDLVLEQPVVFGNGFALNDTLSKISPNTRVCYWMGWGGSLAIIDLDARVTMSYVMNRMEADRQLDKRGSRISAAVYAAL